MWAGGRLQFHAPLHSATPASKTTTIETITRKRGRSGPLLAQLLMLMAERHIGPLKTFAFRATTPLIRHETADLCLKGKFLWVRGPDGRLCMEATAGWP